MVALYPDASCFHVCNIGNSPTRLGESPANTAPPDDQQPVRVITDRVECTRLAGVNN
jgi:hypothetical protein